MNLDRLDMCKKVVQSIGDSFKVLSLSVYVRVVLINGQSNSVSSCMKQLAAKLGFESDLLSSLFKIWLNSFAFGLLLKCMTYLREGKKVPSGLD